MSKSLESEKKKEAYLMWRSIPALLRTLPDADIKKMGYDVDDPLFKRLIEIKNDYQFCAAFGTSNNQARRWRQDPEFMKKVEEVSVHDHVLRFEKELDFSFTQHAIRNGDAARYKLWKQVHKGWTEKTEVATTNVNVDLVALAEKIEQKNREYREAKRLSPTQPLQ